MKLALCQMRMSADEQTNLERGLDALHRAAAAGADLIVYPELQLHLFFPQYEGRDAADKLLTLESPIVRQFQDACRAEGSRCCKGKQLYTSLQARTVFAEKNTQEYRHGQEHIQPQIRARKHRQHQMQRRKQ